MQKARRSLKKRITALGLSTAMIISMVGVLPGSALKAEAASDAISNESLSVEIGDLGQISSMKINNNRLNSQGKEINFVLPNNTSQQNNTAHQWMGEMIFSYRTSEDGSFPDDRSGFVEVDTNKTLAAGGSTTYSNATENLEKNPYIEKNVISDKKVEVDFIGQDANSTTERTMKGFDVKSVYDMETEDGSLLWSITLKNKSEDYIEFGDVGLPMPWNNKYANISDTYNNRMTVHTYAGADSGYAYAIRCSGEGNYMLFTPVPESGARIEYIDQWIGSQGGGMNGVLGTRNGSNYANWTSDTGGWFPGLQVYYIHSKDIQKTGRGYYTDATSLVLKPGEEKTYQFKFSAVRGGDNDPQSSAEDANNATDSVEERENNMRSILYDSGMIDAVAVPSFQTAINMPTKLDLHYDESKISDVKVDIQCVHENDPWDENHIPEQQNGMVNNSKAIEHKDTDSAALVDTKEINGEKHHIYELNFGCIGNNSVRVEYKLNGEDKFTQYEFNVLENLDQTIETHSDFVANQTQDNDPDSATYGIYSDWYFASGRDSRQQSHWGDDWSHDNINFMTMKNYLDPNPEEIKSIEKYLIDFMWNNYMKNTQETYTVSNYLSGSGIYSDTSSPYTRTYSEVMEATGFFNMYRLEKAYPDLIEYRESPEWYLEKAYGIYNNRVGSYAIGFYGEQQIPDMIEALRTEGMTEEADKLQKQFAKNKGTNMARASYPYGSEFEYDNTGEEGAYAAAKALREYYPDDSNVNAALSNMERAEWKTRAMRGIQPTWYQYADPVFRGGETWWNFQYTASLAGSIMDDWLRYQDNGWDTDSSAWAQRVNYAAKISNFNAINMGQISDDYIGNVSWRYTMAKGGQGAQNVNDGGTRVQNNGWNDFSGESDEGLYGSLLRISSDVVTDPVFGLTGYGSTVSKSGGSYTITPLDGVGKRINIIDEKLYVELEQDSCTQAVVKADGTSFDLNVNNLMGIEHVSKITLSGAGLSDGYYSIKVNSEDAGQCYVNKNEGVAYAVVPEGTEAKITIDKMDSGKNTAPTIYSVSAKGEPQALVPFRVESSAYDDGAPEGTLSYKWEVTSAPEGGELTFDAENKPYAEVTASLDGIYKVKFTVSDGELETEEEFEIVVGKAPEKAAPVINEATAVQNSANTTVAELKGSATADTTYNNELKYEWSVVSEPEDGNTVIANADQAEAVMKACVPGTYVLRLTVTDPKTTIYDEDVTTTQDVEIEMTGKVDGIERASIVITQVQEAPKLPETMDVIYPDGTIKTSEITWNEISEEDYASKGQFEVEGIVKDTEIKVAVPVMVVSGKASNLALVAEPSAIIDTPEDLGGVKKLNDGYDPTSSRDTSHGTWHNWRGDNGADAWVQYDWESPVTIYQSNAYYFTDGNFVPKDVWYEYKDVNGVWRKFTNVEGCGNELNQYNVTTFDPVTALAIRMNMSPKTLGCGVIEWQVFGYAEAVIDKTLLRSAIANAKALNLSLFDLDDEAKAALQSAISDAQAVADSKDVSQEEVDLVAARLARIVATLPTADGNLAYSATESHSFCSTWETPGSVNDGRIPTQSLDPNVPKFGTWGNTSAYETITYTWNGEVVLTGADIYFWDNSDKGIQFPKGYFYEYLDEEGNWKQVENPSAYDMNRDGFNGTGFDEVQTTAIRVTLNKLKNSSAPGVGVVEWKVYGTLAPADKTALNEAIEAADKLVEADYSEETWAPFAEALATAKEAAAEEKISAAEINAIIASLVKAESGLVSSEKAKLLAELKKEIEAAKGTNLDLYAEGAEEKLNKAVEAAEVVLNDEQATTETITAAIKALKKALISLPAKDGNIAYSATADGICNYDGQDGRPNDLGGLPTLNDGYEPTESHDTSHGAWHNWLNRYSEGVVQNAWVSYTWDEEVELTGTDVYYFSDHGGIVAPKSVSFEYLNASGEWVPIEEAVELACEEEKYNTVELPNIKTTALRMTMEPEFLNDGDPAHGVGVIEWKVYGKVAGPDKSALEKVVSEAEKLEKEDYTNSSWATLEKALKTAKKVIESEEATEVEIEDARKALARALVAMVGKDEKPEGDNLAPDAAADGICNYDGQDGRPNDLGGLAALNDGYEPTESHDTSHAVWHNWLNRYSEGVTQNAWVSYTWDKEVELTGTDIYYFSDHGGIIAPKSVSFEYLNAAGEWVAVDEAWKLSCVEEEYNTVKLPSIKTTALRMTMEPEFLSDGDPAHGVGVVEWKVYGKYTQATPVVNKEALNAAIAEAEKKAEKDYTAESWAGFARALEAAKAAAADAGASQETVDEQTALLNAAMNALEVAPTPSVDKAALEKLINQAEAYNSADYTEETWADLAKALEAAKGVKEDPSVSQDDVDAAAKALKMAIESLKAVEPVKVDKKELEEAIEKAEGYDSEVYTEDSWKNLEEALEAAKAVKEDKDATQEQVDAAVIVLKSAIEALTVKVPGPETNKDALANLLGEAEKYSRIDYTEESWAVFAEALMNAGQVYADTNAAQEDIDSAAEALKAAMLALVKVNPEVNLDTIRDFIAKAEKLNAKDYSAESWKALQAALQAAKAIANSGDASQKDIDQAAKNLETAMKNLKPAQSGSDKPGTNKPGSSSGTNNVKTGDTSPVIPLTAAGLISLLGIVLVLRRRRIIK